MNLFKQNLVKNLILLLISTVAIAMVWFFTADQTTAQTDCGNATVHVIARDQNGTVIPGISYEISETTVNSDGGARPGKVVASGKISAVLGEGKSVFKPVGGSYVVKMYDKNKSYGAFYFYNELEIACGEEQTFTGILSGLLIELRDTNGTVRKNTSFTISLQARNASGQLIEQKGETVATLNSGASGQIVIYLADDSHTIDKAPASYVFSSKGYGGSVFVLYNISLNSGKVREINYVFSDVLIRFKDKNNNILPSGTKVEFLTQKSDILGKVVADKLIKVLTIDSNGYIMFEYPAGYYFARIKKTNSEYYNFTDIKLVDQARKSLELDVLDSSAGEAPCASKSSLNAVARKASGDYITGVRVELYEKKFNANNLPAAGALIAKGVTNNLGFASLSLTPSSGKAYMLKIYDKNAKAGAFWFYDDIKFTCGENKNISKNLSGITLTARDLSGNLLKNYNFSLYLQKKDADNNLVKTKDNLVVSAKTNAYGQAAVYVTGGDPTQYQDTARYLISIKYKNLIFDQPDINIAAGADTRVNFALSGLNLTVIDAADQKLNKRTVAVYEQKIDANKHKILGKNLAKIVLDNYGKGEVALPAGVYALSFKDKSGKTVNIWDIKIANGSLTSKAINNNKVAPVTAAAASALANRLKGYILLQVEANGEAWYLNPKDKKRYYMQDGAKSFETMRSLGLGVSNSDLSKIPIGVLPVNGESDCDADGLPDSLERAIGALECDQDSDNDGYSDKTEVLHNYDPLGPGKLIIDEKLVVKLSGALLLQVESNVEIWYVNPRDKKRYYIPDSGVGFKVMKYLSLGITNANLNLIEAAE